MEERESIGASHKFGMINSMLERGVPESQVESELVIALYENPFEIPYGATI